MPVRQDVTFVCEQLDEKKHKPIFDFDIEGTLSILNDILNVYVFKYCQ